MSTNTREDYLRRALPRLLNKLNSQKNSIFGFLPPLKNNFDQNQNGNQRNYKSLCADPSEVSDVMQE